jgi:FMN reductase
MYRPAKRSLRVNAMVDLLGIVGSVSSPSKTRRAVELALDAAAQKQRVETDVVHLAEYDLVTADGRPLEDYTGDTGEVLDAIAASDAYLFGTPVYRASYSGALKNLLDMIPRGRWQADIAPLENSAVGLVATGASPHHYLTVDTELRPVMAFFGAQVAGGAYLHDAHFESKADGYRVVDDDLADRLETLGVATVELSRALEGSDGLSTLGPQI